MVQGWLSRYQLIIYFVLQNEAIDACEGADDFRANVDSDHLWLCLHSPIATKSVPPFDLGR